MVWKGKELFLWSFGCVISVSWLSFFFVLLQLICVVGGWGYYRMCDGLFYTRFAFFSFSRCFWPREVAQEDFNGDGVKSSVLH